MPGKGVPPGGGVRTVAVESVVKRPGGLSYVLHIRFERASGGYLDQRFSSHQYDYALTREGLRLRLVSQETLGAIAERAAQIVRVASRGS